MTNRSIDVHGSVLFFFFVTACYDDYDVLLFTNLSVAIMSRLEEAMSSKTMNNYSWQMRSFLLDVNIIIMLVDLKNFQMDINTSFEIW